MTCDKCGRDLPETADQQFCPFCGHNLSQDQEFEDFKSPETLDFNAAPDQYDSEIPWENPEKFGFFQSLFLTTKNVLTGGPAFFRDIRDDGGWTQPLTYALILETLGSLIGYGWSLAFGSANLVSGTSPGPSPLLIAAIPIFALMVVIVWAGAIHLTLVILGGAGKRYEATLRIISYSSATEILAVIPLIGGIVSLIWKLYLVVYGIKEAHSTTTGTAVLAILLPAFVCCSAPLFILGGLLFSLI